MTSRASLLCLLLPYFIESRISSGCSYEFNVVYVQREKPSYEVHTFKNKNKRKPLRDNFVYHFLFNICLFVAANLF